LGHLEAAITSALAISTWARMAFTRGLSGESFASASASESTTWAVAGALNNRTTTQMLHARARMEHSSE
jgi:hypothetical protein